MSTDHCLQLELQSTGPSTPSIILDEQGNVIDSRDGGGEPIQFVFEDISWISEISRKEAARRLDVTFYPFKKVTSFLTGRLLAQLQQRSHAAVVSPPRCPTCPSQRPSSEPRQRANWCIPFCSGERLTTSPAEVSFFSPPLIRSTAESLLKFREMSWRNEHSFHLNHQSLHSFMPL